MTLFSSLRSGRSAAELARVAEDATHRYMQASSPIQPGGLDVAVLTRVAGTPLSYAQQLIADPVVSGTRPIAAYLLSGGAQSPFLGGRTSPFQTILPVYWDANPEALESLANHARPTLESAVEWAVDAAREVQTQAHSPHAPTMGILQSGPDDYRIGALLLHTPRGKTMFPLELFDPLTGWRRLHPDSISAQLHKTDGRLVAVADSNTASSGLERNDILVIQGALDR